MKPYPKVMAVQALSDKRLRVTFHNDEVRIYDCASLLEEPVFRSLRDEAFFRGVSADPHGYGVVWSDGVDLAASELWLHGVPEPTAAQTLPGTPVWAWVVLIGGVLLLAVEGKSSFDNYRLRDHGGLMMGTIVDKTPYGSWGQSGSYVELEYRLLEKGTVRTYRNRISVPQNVYQGISQAGGLLPIIFLPENPNVVAYGTGPQLLWIPGFIGLILFVVGLGHLAVFLEKRDFGRRAEPRNCAIV